MKEKSHRTSPRCYRCGVETYLHAHTRRLDGYSLYTANHVRIRAQRQADRRGLRPAARQFGRRGGPAEEPRYAVGADQAPGRLPGGHAPAGQGAASGPGVGAAARLRARVWLRRLQRRRPAGRRCDPQAAARPRSDRGPGPGLAADAVAVRERGGVGAVAGHGARAGRHGDRDASAAAQGAGDAGSRSISTPPTTRPTASRSSPSSTATTTRGATCRSWRR